MTLLNEPITIRLATRDDHLALWRLAALDSTDSVPSGRVLLAEVGGELHAALSLEDGSAIADPFHPTLHILELLRIHAGEDKARRGRRRALLGLRYALG
ncbi:MAG TPA: hypothetical protein VGH24_12860 [Solirubrobacteraceae bacterium]|jgi:hypothetical protein